MNDSALVQKLRCQDPAAVRHLSDCFLPSVWRFVYVRVNGDRHLAEDIVSETVLALMRAVADDKSDIQNPGAWLRSVASNKVTDHFRAAARVQHLIDEAKKTSPVSDDNDAVKQQELLERRKEIREVMDGLPEQQRMSLEWKYIDKLSVREMAERMQTTEKAVESILFRARREFRQRMTKLKDRDEQPGPVNGTSVRESDRAAVQKTAQKTAALEKPTVEREECQENSASPEAGTRKDMAEQALPTEKVTQS